MFTPSEMLLEPFQPLRARWRFHHLPSQSSGIHVQLGTPTNSDPLLPLIPATISPSVSMKIYPSSTNRFATRLRVRSGQFRLLTSTRLLAPCRSQDMSQHMSYRMSYHSLTSATHLAAKAGSQPQTWRHRVSVWRHWIRNKAYTPLMPCLRPSGQRVFIGCV